MKDELVREQICDLGAWWLEGPLEGVTERLSKVIPKEAKNYTNKRIELHYLYYDDGPSYILYGDRPMTDKEILKEQIKKQKEATKKKKEEEETRLYELKELARLKKKYNAE